MYNLIIYDTSNFEDFPIGGQLTSIRNFLKYIAACRPEYARKILLVGVTTKQEQVGQIFLVEVDGVCFDFLPVLYRDSNLSNVKKSLRLEYVKALLGKCGKLACSKTTVHYIHTPEAYIAVKLRHPTAKTAIFSHGDFFNMVQGFRFFQNNKMLHFLFEQFLIFLLKSADLIFVLDKASEEQYKKYTTKIFKAENSITLPEDIPDRVKCGEPVQLLFVGRLSKIKQIDRIIDAVGMKREQVHLTIVGDGEEWGNLENRIKEKQLTGNVTMSGSCTPAKIGDYYRSSDILVMNSTLEGKPMTILEAMSYGLPVIATPVGGIPELVSEGKEAEYTDETAVQILKKIEIIQKNYSSYAKNALKKSKEYSYKKVNEIIFERIMQL